MDMPENRFKRALKSGSAQLGCWLSLGSHAAAEIAARDHLHRAIEAEDVAGQPHFAVAAATDATQDKVVCHLRRQWAARVVGARRAHAKERRRSMGA